jgi:replicative DNA helicase
VASDVFDEVEHARMAQMEGKPVGLPTGLTDVDRVIGGLQRSDLIIIGGRPSMGKTSWLLSVMLNLLRQKIPVALFSLETSAVQVHQRFVAMETGISTHHMRQGKLDDREWALFVEANARLGTLPYWIDDTPAHAITQMRAQAKRLYHEHGIQALFVDYLQLAVGTARGASNRTQEVSEISRGLKQIARELNIPVVAAAQLNRAVESRADKRPGLADLRESGDIENDADLVAFLYRDSYYHPATDHPNQAEFIVAKQRNGPKDTVLLYFREDQTQFTNLRKEPVDLKSYNTAASFAATSAKD